MRWRVMLTTLWVSVGIGFMYLLYLINPLVPVVVLTVLGVREFLRVLWIMIKFIWLEDP